MQSWNDFFFLKVHFFYMQHKYKCIKIHVPLQKPKYICKWTFCFYKDWGNYLRSVAYNRDELLFKKNFILGVHINETCYKTGRVGTRDFTVLITYAQFVRDSLFRENNHLLHFCNLFGLFELFIEVIKGERWKLYLCSHSSQNFWFVGTKRTQVYQRNRKKH